MDLGLFDWKTNGVYTILRPTRLTLGLPGPGPLSLPVLVGGLRVGAILR
jgi:hypothetical protein